MRLLKKINHIGEITVLHQVKVIGVNQLEQLSYCIHCKKGKFVCESPGVGKCNVCSKVQAPLGKIKNTAKLFLEGPDVTQHVTVRAYDDMLQAIAEDNEITAADLSAPVFDVSYNEYHVITGVSRP